MYVYDNRLVGKLSVRHIREFIFSYTWRAIFKLNGVFVCVCVWCSQISRDVPIENWLKGSLLQYVPNDDSKRCNNVVIYFSVPLP